MTLSCVYTNPHSCFNYISDKLVDHDGDDWESYKSTFEKEVKSKLLNLPHHEIDNLNKKLSEFI
jgi:hypothetical protein